MATAEKLVWSLADSADAAVKTYHTFGEGKPTLIPTGIAAFDKEIGGIGPGSPIIIGASTGLGKSSVALAACLHNQDVNGVKAGYLSCEDTADVVGCRLLARASGVDSKKIRRKELTSDELKAVRSGYDHLSGIGPDVAMEVCYRVSRPLPEVIEGLEALADAGCKIVYLDYIQKIRGAHEDRRNEVGRVFAGLHAAADRKQVGLVFISQVARQYEPNKVPAASALKESGDLEAEARAVLMLGRTDQDTRDTLTGVLRKSNYGAEGLVIKWQRGLCGTLYEVMDGQEEEF
jgi:replicative DNA helicase